MVRCRESGLLVQEPLYVSNQLSLLLQLFSVSKKKNTFKKYLKKIFKKKTYSCQVVRGGLWGRVKDGNTGHMEVSTHDIYSQEGRRGRLDQLPTHFSAPRSLYFFSGLLVARLPLVLLDLEKAEKFPARHQWGSGRQELLSAASAFAKKHKQDLSDCFFELA
jgi:hypothetical protein